MKILREGKGESPWWVGVCIACSGCGRHVAMEKDDNFEDTDPLIFDCGNCGHNIVAYKSDVKVNLAEA